MKTSFLPGLIALTLLLAPSCDRLEGEIQIQRKNTTAREGRGGRAPRGTDSTATVDIPGDGLFLTAVAYPPGYDWRRDTARGNIRGHILLLRMRDFPDGTEKAAFDTVLTLEAGAGRAVSLDPDRHQFAGGHLYTQCLTEAGTVWRCDGKTVLLTKDREYLRGILALDDGIYTLSQLLSGTGFILRRNWKPVLAREEGRLHGSMGDPAFGRTGALFEDGGQACFLYEDGTGQWILVRNGQEQVVPLPSGIVKLYDIRCFEGVIHLVCRVNKREPVLYVGSQKYDLSTTLNAPSEKTGFHLLRTGDGVRVSGTFRLDWNRQLFTALWSEKKLLDTRKGRCDWLDGKAYVCREDGRITAAGNGREDFTLADGGTLMMPACACLSPGGLHLALSGSSAERPVLWIDGRSIPIGFNGFLSSVTVLK